MPIEVDGGIDAATRASAAGATLFVAGSSIFGRRPGAATARSRRRELYRPPPSSAGRCRFGTQRRSTRSGEGMCTCGSDRRRCPEGQRCVRLASVSVDALDHARARPRPRGPRSPPRGRRPLDRAPAAPPPPRRDRDERVARHARGAIAAVRMRRPWHRRTTKFTLTEDRIPTHWVNLLPDLPGEPLPPLNPGTMEPAGPDDLTPIFPMALIGQEVSGDPEVEIPEPVRDAYRLWRPTPLYRAHRLERELDTPAHIYYKYEGVSPAGSHKPNSAVAQAYANKEAGIERLVDGDRRGPVGVRAGARVQPVRARMRRLHGRRELRPEALSARDDGELGRHGDPLAERHHRGRPRARPRTRPARSGSRSRRRSRWPRATRARTTRSARCSTTSASTRP